ncbi:hypothetical protein ES705_25135 [subsurface metagenome]
MIKNILLRIGLIFIFEIRNSYQASIMKSFYYLFFMLFLLTSCTKEVVIYLPDHEGKTVINSFFSPDALLCVHVSRSRVTTDTFFIQETVPVVVLKYAEKTDTLQSTGNGYYVSQNHVPQVETRYSIEVSSTEYGKATASDKIPEEVPFEVINYMQEAGIDVEGCNFSSITIRFNEPPGEKNYYEIKGVHESKPGEKLRYEKLRLWSNDVVIRNEGYDNLIFSDELINGKSHTLAFNFYHFVYKKKIESRFFIHFRSVSENYFFYKKKLMLHFENQISDIGYGTGNPVNLYSNVENGYGIFAGYSEYMDTVTVNEWTGE